MKQEMKLVLRQDVVNGFSYSFAKALLRKLKVLNERHEIFLKEIEKVEASGKDEKLTDMAISIIVYLKEQVFYNKVGTDFSSIEEISLFIKHAGEFLAIFEE